MKISHIILEAVKDPEVQQLKTKIISQVRSTDDRILLNKINTALQSTNLGDRIKKALKRDGDSEIFRWLNSISKAILDTDGTVDDKLAFAEGLSEGYIDIKKMLSGERVHFEDLLVPKNNVNLDFVVRVFASLRNIGGEATKGPGEFSLAVFSPAIRIMGEGDLKIGNKKIELKAEGGRLGSSSGTGESGLKTELNGAIIQSYFPTIEPNRTLGVEDLNSLIKQSTLNPKQLKQFAQELFTYIFLGKDWVDIQPIISAVVNKGDVRKPFTKAAYDAYRGPSDKPKFDGVMMINFQLQELRYFEDFEEMYANSYAASFAVIKSNPAFAGRAILPALKLAPAKVDPVPLPQKTDKVTAQQLAQLSNSYAAYMLALSRVRNPQLAAQVAQYITQIYKAGTSNKTLQTKIRKAFPQLSLRQLTQR